MGITQDDLEWMIGFVKYAMNHTTAYYDEEDYNRMEKLVEIIDGKKS